MSNIKLVLILFFALLLGFAGGFVSRIVDEEPDQPVLSERIDEVNERINILESRVDGIPQDFSFASTEQVKELRSSLDRLEGEIPDEVDPEPSQALTELEDRVQGLEGKIEEVEGWESREEPAELRVGYLNAQETFTVFTDAVSEERERAQQINEELLALREKAIQGEISETEFERESDILQGERLKAQLEINLSMMDQMIEASGFRAVSDQLREFRGQVEPIMEELELMLEDMRAGTVSPDEVSQMLSQINAQYQQLDEMLTRLIEEKIFEVANRKAGEEGYDLLLRQEDVLLYRDPGRIDDLTDTAKETLRAELN